MRSLRSIIHSFRSYSFKFKPQLHLPLCLTIYPPIHPSKPKQPSYPSLTLPPPTSPLDIPTSLKGFIYSLSISHTYVSSHIPIYITDPKYTHKTLTPLPACLPAAPNAHLSYSYSCLKLEFSINKPLTQLASHIPSERTTRMQSFTKSPCARWTVQRDSAEG